MYCWDSDKKTFYAFNKKEVGFEDLPKEAAVRLAGLICVDSNEESLHD
jgi:nitrogenase subunit NifH